MNPGKVLIPAKSRQWRDFAGMSNGNMFRIVTNPSSFQAAIWLLTQFAIDFKRLLRNTAFMKFKGPGIVVTACMLVAALVFLTLTITLFSANQGIAKIHRKIQERNRLIEANLGLAQRITDKYRRIERLKHDPAYIEFIARKNLNMVRKDELVFTAQSPAQSNIEAPQPEKKP
jgi:cell division protein FtsB